MNTNYRACELADSCAASPFRCVGILAAKYSSSPKGVPCLILAVSVHYKDTGGAEILFLFLLCHVYYVYMYILFWGAVLILICFKPPIFCVLVRIKTRYRTEETLHARLCVCVANTHTHAYTHTCAQTPYLQPLFKKTLKREF